MMKLCLGLVFGGLLIVVRCDRFVVCRRFRAGNRLIKIVIGNDRLLLCRGLHHRQRSRGK